MKRSLLEMFRPWAGRGRMRATRSASSRSKSRLGPAAAVACAALVLALAPFLDGCATNPVTGEKEFSVISKEEEIELGKQAYPGAIAELGGPYNDASLAEYVSGVGLGLAKVSHRPDLPYEFTVVGNSMVNAFALPGGKIVITTGLLSRFENEGQLAGVLGHEIGHVTARHAARMISRAYLIQIPLIVGSIYAQETGKGEELVALSSIGLALLQLKYSRDQETQSDRLGMEYAAKAGYNPRGVIQLLEVLQSTHEREPSALEGMLMTHPLTRSRIEDAEEQLAEKYPRWKARTDSLYEDRFARNTRRLMANLDAFEHYQAAEKARQEGDTDKAMDEYRAAVDIDAMQPQFHCGLGETHVQRDDVPQALESFERAKDLAPDLFRGRMDLGHARFLAQSYDAAVEELEAAVSIVRTSPPAHYYLGRSHEKLGNRAEAVEHYENCAALAPDTEMGKDAKQRAADLKLGG